MTLSVIDVLARVVEATSRMVSTPVPPQGAPPRAHASITPIPRSDAGILERQALGVQLAKESEPVALRFPRNSMTHGWEGEGTAIWKAQFAPEGALNLGVSGHRTEYVRH